MRYNMTIDSAHSEAKQLFRHKTKKLAKESAENALSSLKASLASNALVEQVTVEPHTGGAWCKVSFFLWNNAEKRLGVYRKIYIDIGRCLAPKSRRKPVRSFDWSGVC